MQVTQATIDNIDGLTAIFEQYRQFYRKEADHVAAKAFLRKRIINKESIIYIAINDEDKIVGFTQLYPSFSSTRLSKLWILNDLCVDKESRGMGISKLLIARAKQLCTETNACAVILETEKDNLIGNSLYAATGFTLESENHYFWSPGVE